MDRSSRAGPREKPNLWVFGERMRAPMLGLAGLRFRPLVFLGQWILFQSVYPKVALCAHHAYELDCLRWYFIIFISIHIFHDNYMLDIIVIGCHRHGGDFVLSGPWQVDLLAPALVQSFHGSWISK